MSVCGPENRALASQRPYGWREVLIGVDDSKFSEERFKLWCKAQPRRTEVRVLHVVEPIAISVPPQWPPATR